MDVVGHAADVEELGARLQSRAVTGIFILLALYFLYFASPILIPIVTALLLSMLLAMVLYYMVRQSHWEWWLQLLLLSRLGCLAKPG